jgi:hypothetical protein
MFRCFKRSLFEEFDIGPTNRLTRAVKAHVNDVLADLRLEVMHVEFSAQENSAVQTACSAVRWEIDMARRALALRHEVPECDEPESGASLDGTGKHADDCEHHVMLEACQSEFQGAIGVVVSFPSPDPGSGKHRRRVLQSMEALSRSRALLARLRRSRVH